MHKLTNLLNLWKKRTSERLEPPISFSGKDQVCLFTTLPTLHQQLTQDSLQSAIDELQSLLQSRKLLKTASGVFDSETENAVRQFQHECNLYVDGIVGPLTWAALRYPRLRCGAGVQSSELQNQVIQVQQILGNEEFYKGAVDGRFDRETEQAVKAFQRMYGLREDGIVGALTWAVLQGMRQNYPNEATPILGAVYFSRDEVGYLLNEICIIFFIVLGMSISPLSTPPGTTDVAIDFVKKLATAIALTCVIPFLPEPVFLKLQSNPKFRLLRYAPYVLIGIFSDSILHTLGKLFITLFAPK